MGKVVMWKSVCKYGRVTADVAHKRTPFTYLMHDNDRNLVNGEDRFRGLQCARVRRNDDPRERDISQLRGSRSRLLHPQCRQFRILDPRIDASLVEMQIKMALPMTE